MPYNNKQCRKHLASGKLLSPVKSSGKTAEELALDVRNGAHDPADYFDYIYFAWGNCFAGDSLVVERKLVEALGRTSTAEELLVITDGLYGLNTVEYPYTIRATALKPGCLFLIGIGFVPTGGRVRVLNSNQLRGGRRWAKKTEHNA